MLIYWIEGRCRVSECFQEADDFFSIQIATGVCNAAAVVKLDLFSSHYVFNEC